MAGPEIVDDGACQRGGRCRRPRRDLARAALLPLLALLAGCGTQHLYPGAPRDANELALLIPQDYFFIGTRVVAIDGVEANSWKGRYAVLPGRRTVAASMVGTGGGVMPNVGYGPFCLAFEARPGRRYELHGDYAGDFLSWLNDDPWSMWIEDAETGEVVAETGEWSTEDVWAGRAACGADGLGAVCIVTTNHVLSMKSDSARLGHGQWATLRKMRLVDEDAIEANLGHTRSWGGPGWNVRGLG